MMDQMKKKCLTFRALVKRRVTAELHMSVALNEKKEKKSSAPHETFNRLITAATAAAAAGRDVALHL